MSPTLCRVALAISFGYGLLLGDVRCFLSSPRLALAEELQQERALAFFESNIRPALVDYCLDCHASDTEASGGLLLDSRDGWLTGGDSGAAIEPGKPETSRLFRAISYEDPSLQMPPDGRLPAKTIQAFRQWIAQGAVDPRQPLNDGQLKSKTAHTGLPVDRAHEHWAYRSLGNPQVPGRTMGADFTPAGGTSADGKLAEAGSGRTPDVGGAARTQAQSPIDCFIARRLAEADLPPAKPAADAVLVRRLFYDLWGLPPTPEQLLECEQTLSSRGYQALVDRLLASPRFGEHFARKWMDVARYAESITLRGFVLPEAWRYRDYLIDAFNADRPVDQMIREQLAGDLLEADSVAERQRQLVATAFLAMGNTNLEQQDKAQLEMDYIDEQLEVIGRAFLAQTVGCARCHDHKFDPIPTRDYYALAGVFRSAVALDHANVSKWIEEPLPLTSDESRRYARIEAELRELEPRLKELKSQLGKLKKESGEYLDPKRLSGVVLDDQQAKLIGQWQSSTSVKPFVGDNYLYANGRGKTATFEPAGLEAGTYEVRISYTPHPNRATNAAISVFSADGEVTFRVNQRQTPAGHPVWHSLGMHRFEKDGQAYVLISTTDTDGTVIADAVQFLLPGQTDSLENQVPDRNSTQLARSLQAELAPLEERQRQLQEQLKTRPKYLTVVERREPEDLPIHIRGDVHNLGDMVPRGFLTAISPPQPKLNSQSSGRREFAEWVSSAENPLTARVYANRVWSWLMGQGIVSTPNNFGTTGGLPSHPELLDWLAQELIRGEWSTKHLVRSIVQSSAYQRAVMPAAEKANSLDPDNRLYWNGHARRLTVESLRDAMLLVSGELDLTMGGSLIRSGTKADYNYQHASTRRSIYHPVFRNSLPPLFEVFDFADTSVSVGHRPRSTVATQALVLSNHPWVVARVEHATRVLWANFELDRKGCGREPFARAVNQLYLASVGRLPTVEERRICLSFVEQAGDDPKARRERLEHLVHTLFASLDFRFLE